MNRFPKSDVLPNSTAWAPLSTVFYRSAVAVSPEKTEQIDREEKIYQFLPGGFRNSTDFYRAVFEILPFSTGFYRAVSLPMLVYTTRWTVYVVYVVSRFPKSDVLPNSTAWAPLSTVFYRGAVAVSPEKNRTNRP